MPRCPNYSASKAAIHSLAWSLRCQLSGPDSPATHHVRVVEVIPPAVQTELHPQQEDLARLGQDRFGIGLDEYADETWADLLRGDADEVVHSAHREKLLKAEAERRGMWEGFISALRGQGIRF